jgi:hypothetical protein
MKLKFKFGDVVMINHPFYGKRKGVIVAFDIGDYDYPTHEDVVFYRVKFNFVVSGFKINFVGDYPERELIKGRSKKKK